MEAAAKLYSTHFYDPEAATLRAKVNCQLFEQHNSVGNGMELKVVRGRREVIEQDDGAVPLSEEMLEREHLPPVAQRALGKHAHLRQAVEDHARRLRVLYPVEHKVGRFVELHLGRVEDRHLTVWVERCLGRNQFEQVDALQGPPVPPRDNLELPNRLGQRDVKSSLSLPSALHEELHRQGRFARSGATPRTDTAGWRRNRRLGCHLGQRCRCQSLVDRRNQPPAGLWRTLFTCLGPKLATSSHPKAPLPRVEVPP